MKKTITGVVALLAGAFVAYSQGTVQMANYGTGHAYLYVTFKPASGSPVDIGGAASPNTGTPSGDVANGNDWTVAMFGAAGSGDASSTLTECVNTGTGGGFAQTTLANGANDGVAGTWYTSLLAGVPGTTGGGQPATIQMIVWYNDGGTITSYKNSPAYGESATANVTTGGVISGAPPATAPVLPVSTLGPIVVTSPEPSTIALGVMGASAFLLRLRRKI